MKPVLRSVLLGSLCLALLLVGGCAYRVGSIKPSVYEGINNLYVPTFENRTLEPRVSAIVTNEVIKKLQRDGTFNITSRDRADAELRGTIERIERRQLRGARVDSLRTTELLTYIVVRWGLYDPQTGRKLEYADAGTIDENEIERDSGLRIRPGRVVGRTLIFVDSNFQTAERNAMPVAASNAADILVSQLSEGW